MQPSLAPGAGAAILGHPFDSTRDATGIMQASFLTLQAGSYRVASGGCASTCSKLSNASDVKNPPDPPKCSYRHCWGRWLAIAATAV